VGWVSDAALSADGALVASCGNDGTVRLWDLERGVERWARGGHDSKVLAVAWTPEHVVSGSFDGGLRAWDAASGREVARLAVPPRVLSLAVAPDGRVLWSNDAGYGAWLPGTGGHWSAHRVGVTGLAALDDRWALAGGRGGELWLLPLHPPADHHTSLLGAPVIAVGGSGGAGLCITFDGRAHRVDAVERRVTLVAQTAATRGLAAGLSADGRRGVLCDEAGAAHVFDLEGGAVLGTFRLERPGVAVALAPDGSWAVTSELDRVLRLRQLPSGEVLDRLDLGVHREQGVALAVRPEGDALAVGTTRGVVLRVDVVR
jgi:WD40 repeat protein